ncbi:alpha/beta hydrolase [Ramlibacter tataouinensis]|uniref:esterase/lipase family protein n=1 Tax=Ramlibacter tataouinensis TaxID=94132 RepID=UPI0022F3ACF0|nr:alpha/beta hydrolase [Ramlibacter tataouinensis]WBY00367.1 alpha/beta hydrolase [Ramlibacter tataouinensis]
MPSPAPTADPPWPRHAAAAVRDLRGGMRLVMDGVALGIDRIEAAHDRLARVRPAVRGARIAQPRTGWGTVIYHGLRGTAGLAGGVIDLALASLQASLADPRQERDSAGPSPRREALLAALNAVAGDHLQRTDNPLLIRTRLQRAGSPTPRVLVLVHDLGLDPLHWQTDDGQDHGQALAAAIDATPVLAHYSSGRPVAAVGRELASELQAMLSQWPVALQGVVLVGHGLGGLVLRSALHQAGRCGMAWPARVRHVVFLGTPHGGAAPGRVLAWLARIGAGRAAGLLPLARLPRRHSAGIDDFLHGRVLPADPRAGAALPPDADAGLPPTLRAHAIAGAVGDGLSDGLVPVASALGRAGGAAGGPLALPEERRWVARGVDHMGLLASDAVFRTMRQWLSA